MLSLISWLPNIFSLFDVVGRVTEKLVDAKVQLASAANEKERIAADERIKSLEARRAVLISEGGSRLNGFIRAGFALPFVVYNAKLVLWDKVLAWGSTDPLSVELFQVELACIGFYFLYDIAAKFKR